MKFKISGEIFNKFPRLKVGLLIVSGADNTKNNEEITAQLRENEAGVRAKFNIDTLKDHPKIASLQEVHRNFGSNPNKFPPSHQALIKRVLKGGQLPSINPLVDIYNIISLKYAVPAGGEDLDQCVGDIRLAFAEGNEDFLPLGEQTKDPPKAGELVYKDDKGVICRRLDWREGDRTKLTAGTKNAVLVIEAFPPVTSEELTNALSEMKGMAEKYCGAKCAVRILGPQNVETEL